MKDNEKITLVQPEENSPEEKELGMGWHDFLVIWYGIVGWVGIIASIAMIVLGAIALEPAGMLGGILSLGLAAITLATRKKLNDFESDAIDFLKIMYGARLVNIFMDIFLSLSINPSHKVDIKDVIFDVLRVVIFAAINLSYYKKREDMFCDEDDDEE